MVWRSTLDILLRVLLFDSIVCGLFLYLVCVVLLVLLGNVRGPYAFELSVYCPFCSGALRIGSGSRVGR